MDVHEVQGTSDITGGGFEEQITGRIPEGSCANIEKYAVREQMILSIIQDRGSIPDPHMFNTYNMGVGMQTIVAKDDADKALTALKESGQEA
jgi:Phosphoribosylaminoimidazole (AIR) synthetase